VNSGGTIAKSLALLKGHRGISFLSLPIDMDAFDNLHEEDLVENATQWASSIVNADGLFSGEDSGFGENFALMGDETVVGYDGVYPSFCNLAETCGYHTQFVEYCKKAIGEDELSSIIDYLRPSG
jgi:hypothetical protein